MQILIKFANTIKDLITNRINVYLIGQITKYALAKTPFTCLVICSMKRGNANVKITLEYLTIDNVINTHRIAILLTILTVKDILIEILLILKFSLNYRSYYNIII